MELNKKAKIKYYLSAFLIMVVLTSSIYIMMPDKVKIHVFNTNTEFSVWENEKWELAATEYVYLWDGSTKMRASSREVLTSTEGNITLITRESQWKDNITTIDTYTFDSRVDDVKLIPIEHTVRCINCESKIVSFEYRDILYEGETKEISSPFEFGHNMKVEWQDGSYYSKVFQQSIASDKIIIKYRPQSNDEIYSVRLFDPPVVNTVYILPALPTTSDELLGYCNVTETSDTITEIGYQWYKNDVLDSSGTYNNTFCFQEFANISTACGGLSTGSYSFDDGDWFTQSYAYDGDYITASGAYPTNGTLNITYTIPQYASNKSLWQLWAFNLYENLSFFTLHPSCWNYSGSGEIKFKLLSGIGEDTYGLWCMNDTGWEEHVWSNPWADAFIYEEAMYWDLGRVSENIDLLVNTMDDTLILGDEWILSCNSTNSSGSTSAFTNSSTVTVTTTPPVIVSSRILTNNVPGTIFGYCSGSDSDEDIINFYYKWYKNDILNLSGYKSPSICYQESTNTSDQTGIDGVCGLDYSGFYIDDTPTSWYVSYPIENSYDGDYDTYARAELSQVNATISITYIKPADSTNNSLWYVKDGSSAGTTISELSVGDCWDSNLTHLNLRVKSCESFSGVNDVVIWYCLNGTEEILLRQSPVANQGNRIYDEAMKWNISYSDNNEYLINSTTAANSDTNWTFSCLTTDGTKNSSWLNSTTELIYSIGTIFVDGVKYNNNSDLKIELATTYNISTVGSSICLDINHPNYGVNTSCGTNGTSIIVNITYMNTTITDQLFSYNATQNKSFVIAAHQYDAPLNITFNLTGTSYNGSFPTNLDIYLGDTLVKEIVTVTNTSDNELTYFYNQDEELICLQEFANVSTSCGGLSTGSYYASANWTDADALYDGDWDTYSNSTGSAYLDINYSTPYNFLGPTKFRYKDTSGTTTRINYIDTTCTIGDTIQLRINKINTSLITFSCYNGSDWLQMFNESATGIVFYESQISWTIYNTINFTEQGTKTAGYFRLPKDSTVTGTTMNITGIKHSNYQSFEPTSSTFDLYRKKESSSWLNMHCNPLGSDDADRISSGGYDELRPSVKQTLSASYWLYRSFNEFDTSNIDSTYNVEDVILNFNLASINSNISIQKVNFGNSLGIEDYCSIEGDLLGSVLSDSELSRRVQISFDQSDYDYINISGKTQLLYREYNHDYLDVAPAIYTEYYSTLSDFNLNISLSSYPYNIWIQIGDIDENKEYNYTGEFTTSATITDFEDQINDYLDTCSEDADGYCNVPIYAYSEKIGAIAFSDIQINYTYQVNPVTINSSDIQTSLDTFTGSDNLNVTIQSTSGTLNVTGIEYNYRGGNKTYTLLSHTPDYSTNYSIDLVYYYSRFLLDIIPRGISYWDIGPNIYTWVQNLITPYGNPNGDGNPFFNVTSVAYGGNMDLYLKSAELISPGEAVWFNWSGDNESPITAINSIVSNFSNVDGIYCYHSSTLYGCVPSGGVCYGNLITMYTGDNCSIDVSSNTFLYTELDSCATTWFQGINKSSSENINKTITYSNQILGDNLTYQYEVNLSSWTNISCAAENSTLLLPYFCFTSFCEGCYKTTDWDDDCDWVE